jgi:hypothetical protein
MAHYISRCLTKSKTITKAICILGPIYFAKYTPAEKHLG